MTTRDLISEIETWDENESVDATLFWVNHEGIRLPLVIEKVFLQKVLIPKEPDELTVTLYLKDKL